MLLPLNSVESAFIYVHTTVARGILVCQTAPCNGSMEF